MVLQIWMLGPLGRLPRPDLCYPLWCHLMTFHSTRHLVAGYHDHLVILGSLRGRNKCWVKKLNTEFWLRSSRASGPLIKYHLAQPPPTNEMKIKLSWCERITLSRLVSSCDSPTLVSSCDSPTPVSHDLPQGRLPRSHLRTFVNCP